jgi:4-hydroxy 2-oxovalerate aldolase
MKNINILDCTLRDGGFHTNWNFDSEVVRNLLKSLDENGVSIIEMGYKSPNSVDVGEYKICNDTFIKSIINFDINAELSFMIDVKDFIKDDKFDMILFKKTINHSSKSPFSYCRIATTFHQLKYINEIIAELKYLNYKVITNLMQISLLNYTQIKQYIDIVKNKVDCIYIADSLGTLESTDIQNIFGKHKINGIHAHDNMGLAFSNSLLSLKYGCSFIDSTITGMGRGVGNVKTEQLVLYKNKTITSSLLDCVDYFNSLNSKKEWGYNPIYMMTAMCGISPIESQKINKMKEALDNGTILSIINQFKK